MSTPKVLQPLVSRNHFPVTADTTLGREQTGDCLIHNTGAAGTVVVTLPVGQAKMKCRFLRTAAQTLTIDPNGTEIIKGQDGVSLGAGVAKSLTAAGAYCELEFDGVAWNVLHERPTLDAAGLAIADAGSFTAATTMEAALQEVYQHLLSAQKTVSVPLASITREDGTALTKQATDVAGFSQIGNKEVVINIPVDCSAGEALAFNVPMPRDLDDTKDVIVDVLVSKAANLDALTLDAEAYFVAAGDLGNADAQDTAAQTIVAAGTVLSFTCGADDVPAAPCAVTVVLTVGGVNDGDAIYIHAAWVRYTAKLLTS